MGEHAVALATLEDALATVGEGRPEAAALQIELAFNAFWAADYEGAVRRATEAVETARRGEDRMLLATALAIHAFALALGGDSAAAEESRVEAAELIDAAGDAAAARLDAFQHLGWAENFLGRFDASIAHLERGKELARATGQGQHLSVLDGGLTASLSLIGRLADARELAAGTVELARLSVNSQALVYGLAGMCWVATLGGDLAEAGECARELEGLVGEEVGAATNVYAAVSLADYHLQTGKPERGLELAEANCGGPDLPLVPRGRMPHYLETICRVQIGAGRIEAAEEAAERAERVAEDLGLAHAEALARRARAEVLLAQGKHAEAAEAALESARLAESSGSGLDVARARLVAGRALAAAGDRDRALEELTAAESALAAMEAERLRGEAARELRRLGRRIRGRAAGGAEADSGLAALTGREREIAELVTARKTNREIAEELVLSEKTIESHLRNVFAKLGVSKRAELARVVEGER
jgi:ATP/maltotriose-dependent transcriptional regulator MalT